jgi:CTP-dependent riboflavin kinase
MNEPVTTEVRFRGRVASGVGEGRRFSSLDWLHRQLRAGFGFVPVPGTFNVRIDQADVSRFQELQRHAGLAIVPPNAAFCAAKCFAARVGAFNGALVIPMVPNYRQDVLEILAPVNLRAALGVVDDDLVEVLVETVLAGGSGAD